MSTKSAAKLATATVSVCVTLDEAQLVRDAANVAGLTVSAWGANRVLQALASPKTRARVAEVAHRIERTHMEGVRRDNRVSMVLRLQDNDLMKEAAAGLQIRAHAFAQAAFLDAAESELNGVPQQTREAAEAVRRPSSKATLLVAAPRELADLDADELSKVVRQLIQATATFVLDGKGRGVIKGIAKVCEDHADKPQATFKLSVPEFDLRAVAYVLGVRPEPFATALLIKAATTVREHANG